MRPLACLNGEFLPPDEAKVSIWDRGFLFGDAVYEVFRLYQGRPWLEKEHTDRLGRSLDAIRISGVDLAAVMGRVRETIARSEIREGTVYVQITRGVAPRKHSFPDPPVPPTELIVVRPYDDAPMVALREAGAACLTLPDLRWKRCDIKSTNLLANVLAQEDAKRAGCYEAIFIDGSGTVTESAHTSLLWVRSGKLEGTPEGWPILPGTTRGLTLKLAERCGLSFADSRITSEELFNADEVILVGTSCEVLPVVKIDDRPIGGGQAGPVARQLQQAYAEELRAWLARGA